MSTTATKNDDIWKLKLEPIKKKTKKMQDTIQCNRKNISIFNTGSFCHENKLKEDNMDDSLIQNQHDPYKA